jgi:uncharacterized protein
VQVNSDWTLIVLAAAGNRALSPVQLQKALFLLAKECPVEVGDAFYTFRPYNYGPFSEVVYSDADELVARGLAERLTTSGRRWVEYGATDRGRLQAQKLRTELPVRAVSYIDALVPWVCGLSFEQLVRAIYVSYPEMRANSIFKG